MPVRILRSKTCAATALPGKGENMSPSTTSKVTTDHGEIRRWAEERGAKPAAVIRTESDDDPGIIRLDFPGYSGAGSLEEISWDDWFKKFDERGLALLYQEHTANGEKSNFNKIISRDTAEEVERSTGGKGRSASHKQAGKSAKRAAASRSNGAARSSSRSYAKSSTSRTSSSSRERRLERELEECKEDGRGPSSRKATSARGRGSSSGRGSARGAQKRSTTSSRARASRTSSRTTSRAEGRHGSARSSGTSRTRSRASSRGGSKSRSRAR
jgi:hypothetical protein